MGGSQGGNHNLSGGNLQSCKVKSTLDERTFGRIAIHKYNLDMFEHYKVELDASYFPLDDGCNGLTKKEPRSQMKRLKTFVNSFQDFTRISVSLVKSDPFHGSQSIHWCDYAPPRISGAPSLSVGFEKSKAINIRFPLWSLPLNESWEPPPFYGPLIKSPKSPMAQDLVLGFTCISQRMLFRWPGQNLVSYQTQIFVAFQHCRGTIRTLTEFPAF